MTRLALVRLIFSALLSALLLVTIKLAEPNVAAQDLDNVTLTGRVLDQNGALIPGATIDAILVKTGATRTTVSDDEGSYRIIQLEPGIYNLRASSSGFTPQEKRELAFIAGKNVQLEFTLLPRGGQRAGRPGSSPPGRCAARAAPSGRRRT